ncbi:DUF2783 domain-containing protein [Massilia cavernae]|uniref:DUF2783 domain-containing protein n=1 Tax=Massilia cavernae TaxID=2320864 RepID=A0A418Y6E6_9BURK|nr:DUF2783 domain-containing protein [Massilia cavernae]RJG23443.1 DUF2783 domain-containing protein [Massilia cavernae]
MNQSLITAPNLERADDFYEALIDTHRDLSEAQSQMLNAKLVLILANQVGSHQVLVDAMRLARDSMVVEKS